MDWERIVVKILKENNTKLNLQQIFDLIELLFKTSLSVGTKSVIRPKIDKLSYIRFSQSKYSIKNNTDSDAISESVR